MVEEGKTQTVSTASPKKDCMLEMVELFDHPSTVLWRAVEARHILNLLSKITLGGPVLDLGCGEGMFSSTIFGRGKMDVGLDIFKDDIVKAKRLNSYKALIVADARALPFRCESFNVLFSNCVIEHIPRVDEVLSEVSRVLKSNGIFIFTVPSSSFSEYLFVSRLLRKIGLRKRARWYSEIRNKLLSHYNIFDLAVWQHKLMNANFNVAEFRYYLSKNAVSIWDFIALCIFAARRSGIFNFRILKLLLANSKGIRISIFKKILYKYYYQDCQIGGGLLIVAKRS
jgi:ubiquinone/menaquinone biosynthesis C-methylase UbiE